MTRTVEAVAPYPRLMPRRRDRITRRRLGHPLIKGGLKESDQRHARKFFAESPDAECIRRIMRGRNFPKLFERDDHPLIRISPQATGEVLAEHSLKTNRVNISGRADVPAGL